MPPTTSLDYAKILERIPVEFKRETYERMLKGTTDAQGQKQPGLAEQFMDAYTEARAYEDMVDSRRAIVEAMEPDPNDATYKSARSDLSQMIYLLAVRQERLEVVGKELERIQDSLENIKQAG